MKKIPIEILQVETLETTSTSTLTLVNEQEIIIGEMIELIDQMKTEWDAESSGKEEV